MEHLFDSIGRKISIGDVIVVSNNHLGCGITYFFLRVKDIEVDGSIIGNRLKVDDTKRKMVDFEPFDCIAKEDCKEGDMMTLKRINVGYEHVYTLLYNKDIKHYVARYDDEEYYYYMYYR
jgi:hypothetical protein